MSDQPKSLRAQRKERGWSVAQLSQLSGVNIHRIRVAEMGRRIAPSCKLVLELALTGRSEPPPRKTRGFSAMPADRQREFAKQGGKASHEKGTGHEFTIEEARAAGKKGGLSASRDREHMSAIGKLGGQKRAEVMKQRALERREQIEQKNTETIKETPCC